MITIILPTYNRLLKLKKAIDLLTNQSFDANLIIINDASEDGTKEYLSKLQLPRLTVIHNIKNLGLQKSLNIAIEKTKTKYIARLDDDDFWIDVNKLKKQIKILEENPTIGVIGTAYIDEEGNQVYNPLTDKEIRQQILFRCPFCHSTVIFRKEIWVEYGGYDVDISYGEDWDLWLKAGKKWKLANLPDITTQKGEDESTMSHKNFRNHQQKVFKIVNPYITTYPRARLAIIYHYFTSLFFFFIPLNSFLHRIAQKVFKICFVMNKIKLVDQKYTHTP